MKGVLDAIAAQPMMRAFGRLPTKVTEVFGRYLFTQRPHLSHLQVPGPPTPAAGRGGRRRTRRPRPHSADLGRRPTRSTRSSPSSSPAAGRAGRPGGRSATVRDRLSDGRRRLPGRCSPPRGRWLAVDDAFGGGPGKDEKTVDPAAEPAWVALAESVAATQVVIYVSQFFVQLRNLVWAAVVTSSLLAARGDVVPVPPGEAAPDRPDRPERRPAWPACCTC